MATSLKFNASKVYTQDGHIYKINVEIRLNDECKNRICDFAITGSGYRKARNGRWVYVFGGCCHDEILKHFPQFQIFVNLHNCSHYGQPLYPVENGMYFLKEKELTKAMDYLRITEEEAKELKDIALTDDKIYFRSALYGMGIIDRWQKEADQARAELENLCGQKWENPYNKDEERFRIPPVTNEDLTQLNEKIKIGYYTKEAIKMRAEAKAKADREKARREIIERYDKDIRKAEINKNIMLAVFDFGINTDNVIYYDHSNKLSFNWRGYGQKISQETFIDFCNNVDKSKLPEGITFEIK